MAGDSAHTSRSHKAHWGNLCGFLGKGLEGRTALSFLPLNTEILASKQQCAVPDTQINQTATSSGTSCDAATSRATASSN